MKLKFIARRCPKCHSWKSSKEDLFTDESGISRKLYTYKGCGEEWVVISESLF